MELQGMVGKESCCLASSKWNNSSGVSKTTDKDDTSSDSVYSAFEKMKPYWVRTEVDDEPQCIPISPISSESCLNSINHCSMDESRTAAVSPVFHVQTGTDIPMYNNGQQIQVESCSPHLYSSIVNHWLSYQTTRSMFQMTTENKACGNQMIMSNGGIYPATTKTTTKACQRIDSWPFFYAIQWQSCLQQDNEMQQRIHPLHSYGPLETKLLPTVEPGDFSTSGNASGANNASSSCNDQLLVSSKSQENTNLYLPQQKIVKKRQVNWNKTEKLSNKEATLSTTKNTKSSKKSYRDNYLRFEPWEEENLIRGVEKFGVGKWTSILKNFSFHKKRSAIDLKDKYRNMVRAKRRAHLAHLSAMKL